MTLRGDEGRWTGPPVPFRWDLVAAEAASAQMSSVGQSIRATEAILRRDRHVASDDWQGCFRTNFDIEIESITRELLAIADALQETSVRIAAGSEAARVLRIEQGRPLR